MNTSFEYQYKDSLERILNDGVLQATRTGIDTYVVQHQDFIIPDIVNNFPILRGKKVYPLMGLKELLWMLKGRTDVQWLRDRGVTYWDEWEQEDGTIGKSYGYQFRNFNGIDQLQYLYDNMLEEPLSRRHILSLWNVNDLQEMVLPPCMYNYNFNCMTIPNLGLNEDVMTNLYQVNLHAHIRSNDAFLGVPYDFMWCGWFLILTCYWLNFNTDKHKFFPGNIYYTADNYHLYINHKTQAEQYIFNVNENKFHVIDIPTSIIDTKNMYIAWEEYSDDKSLDKFLEFVEDYIIKNKNIKLNNNFEYGPIKADIAV